MVYLLVYHLADGVEQLSAFFEQLLCLVVFVLSVVKPCLIVSMYHIRQFLMFLFRCVG